MAVLLLLGQNGSGEQPHKAAQSLSLLSSLGSILGKIDVETPKYSIEDSWTKENVELRKYPEGVAVETLMDSADDSGFRLLAQYIGVFGEPANRNTQAIAMTAPVVTKEEGRTIAMTAPVITEEKGARKAMQFILPSEYKSIKDAPEPTNKDVHLVAIPERLVAVERYAGTTSPLDTENRARRVADIAEANGYEVAKTKEGGIKYTLGRYNPPWTIPWFRRNEVMVELKGQ